jgi:hypothetical protein
MNWRSDEALAGEPFLALDTFKRESGNAKTRRREDAKEKQNKQK